MSLGKNNLNADLEDDTNHMVVKLSPFNEQRLFDSLITKQHFVLIGARDVSELADENGNLIASQIRNYTPEKILQTFDKIGGADEPFYTVKLITRMIPIYTFKQIMSNPVMSCTFNFDEVEFDGINQQIAHIARLINVQNKADAQQFIHNMKQMGFSTKCTFDLEIGTTYTSKKPTTKCFKWRVEILPSGQAVFGVGLYDSPEDTSYDYEIQLAVSFDKLIEVVLGQ